MKHHRDIFFNFLLCFDGWGEFGSGWHLGKSCKRALSHSEQDTCDYCNFIFFEASVIVQHMFFFSLNRNQSDRMDVVPGSELL